MFGHEETECMMVTLHHMDIHFAMSVHTYPYVYISVSIDIHALTHWLRYLSSSRYASFIGMPRLDKDPLANTDADLALYRFRQCCGFITPDTDAEL